MEEEDEAETEKNTIFFVQPSRIFKFQSILSASYNNSKLKTFTWLTSFQLIWYSCYEMIDIVDCTELPSLLLNSDLDQPLVSFVNAKFQKVLLVELFL